MSSRQFKLYYFSIFYSFSINDIYSGANPTDSTATPIVTVITATNHNFEVGTPVLINGVGDSNYDGSYIVSQILSDTSFTLMLYL